MKSPSHPSIILLFIKAPLIGTVKSRLAAAIGDYAACELYKCFVLDAFTAAKAVNAYLKIFFSPAEAERELTTLLGDERSMINSATQKGHNLGERMEQAFSATFAEGNARAVLIGGDIPDLTPQILQEALSALVRSDVVIGPASDGGYYLIGFNAATFAPEVFHDIPWSTQSVYNQTMSIFSQKNLNVHVLPELSDIDNLHDLRFFFDRRLIAKKEMHASRTMMYLLAHNAGIFLKTSGEQ